MYYGWRLEAEYIVQEAKLLQDFLVQSSYEVFEESWVQRRVMERVIEIVSEAARAIPSVYKQEHPHIVWHDVENVGNVLRHAYEEVDPKVIWAIYTNDLPVLVKAVTTILEKHRS
jgi:uncharacterized protein with HEPN domain